MKKYRMLAICSMCLFTTAMTLGGCGGGSRTETDAAPTTDFVPPAVSAPSPPQVSPPSPPQISPPSPPEQG